MSAHFIRCSEKSTFVAAIDEEPRLPNVKIAKTHDIPSGQGKAFDVGDRCIAVFNIEGKFFAIDDTCPHKGASLAKGFIGQNDIVCPLHNATFSLETGEGLAGPCGPCVMTYRLTVSGDDLEIELP